MIIVTSIGIRDNPVSGESSIILTSEAAPVCPLCHGELKYRDKKPRKSINYLGEVKRFMLRRLRCQSCLRLHTEIPDTIQPYKHYDSEAVQMVIDEDERAESCVADASTMRRWKAEMAEVTPDLTSRLVSCYVRETDEVAPIVAAEHIICEIKKRYRRWLAFVMKMLINMGHKLCTRFAFCPSPSPDKVAVEAIRGRQIGGKHVKKEDDSG